MTVFSQCEETPASHVGLTWHSDIVQEGDGKTSPWEGDKE